MDLQRVVAVGSIDDGKSTLVGRLLCDLHRIPDDQIDEARKASGARRHGDGLDLSLITDGLRAERQSGITLDVAYRFFGAAKRRFIVADTPGHPGLTRNMLTGASLADAALVLADVRNGITEQTRLHVSICLLLGIPTIVVCVNKMDLVGYRRDAFESVCAQFNDCFGSRGSRVRFVPVSALHGDNVVTPSDATAWYQGPCLIAILESLPANGSKHTALRVPIQLVLTPTGAPRPVLAGRVASGVLRAGDRVIALPGGADGVVQAIAVGRDRRSIASAPLSVTVELDRDLRSKRGTILVDPTDVPIERSEAIVEVCWLCAEPLRQGQHLRVLHASGWKSARVAKLIDRMDLQTMQRVGCGGSLGTNQIGRVLLGFEPAIAADSYDRNRTMGSLLLVDPESGRTCGAGMVVDVVHDQDCG